MIFLQLFYTFFKIGLFGFGGGYAMLSMIQGEVVTRYGWLTPQEFTDIVAISQMTPGPIGINSATYVGYTQHGVTGAVLATLGMITPAMILVILAIRLLKRWESSLAVQGFLTGMRPAAFGLILSAAVIFAELSVFTGEIPWGKLLEGGFPGEIGIRPAALLIAAATTVIMLRTKISFMYLLLPSAVLGAFFCR